MFKIPEGKKYRGDHLITVIDHLRTCASIGSRRTVLDSCMHGITLQELGYVKIISRDKLYIDRTSALITPLGKRVNRLYTDIYGLSYI